MTPRSTLLCRGVWFVAFVSRCCPMVVSAPRQVSNVTIDAWNRRVAQRSPAVRQRRAITLQGALFVVCWSSRKPFWMVVSIKPLRSCPLRPPSNTSNREQQLGNKQPCGKHSRWARTRKDTGHQPKSANDHNVADDQIRKRNACHRQ